MRKAALSGPILNIPVKSSILEHGEQKKCFYVNISNSSIQEYISNANSEKNEVSVNEWNLEQKEKR